MFRLVCALQYCCQFCTLVLNSFNLLWKEWMIVNFLGGFYKKKLVDFIRPIIPMLSMNYGLQVDKFTRYSFSRFLTPLLKADRMQYYTFMYRFNYCVLSLKSYMLYIIKKLNICILQTLTKAGVFFRLFF